MSSASRSTCRPDTGSTCGIRWRRPAGAPADAPPVIGYVSQACHSPNVGRAIALAVLDDGRRRIDERIEIAAIDRRAPALVTRPCFVDPSGG